MPADHGVRAIAAVIDKLDLRGLYADVRARGDKVTGTACLFALTYNILRFITVSA